MVPLLSHTSDDVARSAAEAISIMSVDIEVKKEALSLGCALPLQQLLLRSPSVQLAACQVNTCLHFLLAFVGLVLAVCCCACLHASFSHFCHQCILVVAEAGRAAFADCIPYTGAHCLQHNAVALSPFFSCLHQTHWCLRATTTS